MFSWYKYLIVNFVVSHLGFWSGNLFLIAPFPDLCRLVPSQELLNLSKKSKLLEIVNHYNLSSFKTSLLKQEIKNIIIQFFVDEEILNLHLHVHLISWSHKPTYS